jgi:hypothetical protein
MGRVKMGHHFRKRSSMAVDERLLGWFKQERESLLQQLRVLQSGALSTGEKRAPGTVWVETTARDVERIKRQLGEIDDILSRLVSGKP